MDTLLPRPPENVALPVPCLVLTLDLVANVATAGGTDTGKGQATFEPLLDHPSKRNGKKIRARKMPVQVLDITPGLAVEVAEKTGMRRIANLKNYSSSTCRCSATNSYPSRTLSKNLTTPNLSDRSSERYLGRNPSVAQLNQRKPEFTWTQMSREELR